MAEPPKAQPKTLVSALPHNSPPIKYGDDFIIVPPRGRVVVESPEKLDKTLPDKVRLM